MTRTQIQLPDELYAKAKKIAKDREISLAELTRTGLEYIISTYPDIKAQRAGKWQPPKPVNAGWKNLSHSEIKEAIQDDEDRIIIK